MIHPFSKFNKDWKEQEIDLFMDARIITKKLSLLLLLLVPVLALVR